MWKLPLSIVTQKAQTVRITRFLSFFFCWLIGISLIAAQPDHVHTHEAPSGIDFISNQNQWENGVEYRAFVPGGEIFLMENHFWFVYYDAHDLHKIDEAYHNPEYQGLPPQHLLNVNGHAFRVDFPGANTAVLNAGFEQKSHYYNYFLGNDQAKWAGHVPAFEGVKYQDLYPGIDLKVYSEEGNFKYDFEVAANANPALIRVKYEGAKALRLKEKGLEIETTVGNFMELNPYAYQMVNGKAVEVTCNYRLNGDIITFELGPEYNPALPLTIDPTLIAATYSGTTASVYGHSATYDDAGNIYSAGGGFAPGGLPVTAGAFQTTYGGSRDYCINKYNPDGSSLIYATYVGGTDQDLPHSLVTNSLGELYILGSTRSTDFPVSSGAYQSANGGTSDIAVTHLDVAGAALIGSTYIGGTGSDGENSVTNNYGDRYRGEIIVDAFNDAYVAMVSSSTNFPVTSSAFQSTLAGGQDAVAFKLNYDMSILEFSTYVGSSSDDAGLGLIYDQSGGVYLTGSIGSGATLPTAGSAFPTHSGGSHDGFIMHLDAVGGSTGQATYFGSSGMDQSFFIEADRSDNVYIFGQTDGSISATAGVYSGPSTGMFIAKFNPDLTTHYFTSTSGDLAPTAFLVDNCGYIYIAGHGALGTLGGFDVSPTAINATGAGFYLMVLEPNATAFNYGTYYGNSGSHVDGGTSRFDKRGAVYEGTCSSGGFPTTPTAYATSSSASWDIAPFKIDFETNPMVAQAAAAPASIGCAPYTVNFINNSTATTYIWDFGDGSPTTNVVAPTHTFTNPGTYTVILIAIDSSACIPRDTIYLPITVASNNAVAAFTDSVDCVTSSVFITNNCVGGTGITWNMGDGTTNNNTTNFTHTYASPGTYTIQAIVHNSFCGTPDTATSTVTILPAVTAALAVNPGSSGCTPFTVNFTGTATNATTYDWDFGDGNTSTQQNPTHTYTSGGTFTVTFTASNPNTCNLSETVTTTINVEQSLIVDADFSYQYDCAARTVTLTNNSTSDPNVIYSWNLGDGTTYTTPNVVHPYANAGTYNIMLVVTDTACGDQDTLIVPVDADQLDPIDVGPRRAVCPGDSLILDVGPTTGSILWSTGETTQTIVVNTGGTYYVAVESGTCVEQDHVIIDEAQELNPGYTTEICVGIEIKLDAGGASAYSWDVGYTSRYLTVTQGGIYPFNVTDRFGCTYRDSILVEEIGQATGPFVPNAFTPNGDGLNDMFEIKGFNEETFEVSVFDRWGKQIFYSQSVNDSWDGRIDGMDAPEGAYVYKVIFENPCTPAKDEILTGTVTLYR